MNTKFILPAIACLLLESFSGSAFRYGNGRPHTEIISDTLSYRYDSVKTPSAYKFTHAAVAETQAYVRVLYPVFKNDALNDVVKKTILSALIVKYRFKNPAAAGHPALSNLEAINNPATEYHELAANFLKQFEAQAPQQELQAYWYANIEATVITDHPGYIAILCKKDFFTGGLHDLYEHIYLNYDARHRNILTLTSQFKPGKLSEIKVIAERIFRKNDGLKSTENLDGYFFANGKFNLPTNFTISSKGLMFLYDYYEIKPFAAGTTSLLIPFNNLKELVMPGSVLERESLKNEQ